MCSREKDAAVARSRQFLRDLEKKELKDTACPRCGALNLFALKTFNAISRLDRTTEICTDCGIDEARQGVKSKVWWDEKAGEDATVRGLTFRLTGEWGE